MRDVLARYQGWLLIGVTAGACLLGSWAISLGVTMPERDGFNIVEWELRHVPGKWLYQAGRLFKGELSAVEEDERLAGFLLLSARIEELERSLSSEDEGQRAELARLRDERNELENDAEAVIEGRLTAVLEEAGLESSLPLFPEARWVWPPVDVEFDEPPRSLAISPRERIELIERRPLKPGLPLSAAVDLEAEEERGGDRSALVGPISGAATYPSIVAPVGGYERLVATVAHEWVHHYLFFKPLGRRYYASNELRTLNETVADIAGAGLAALLVERYPLPPAIEAELASLAPAAPAVDVGAALRELRIDVEAQLDEGRVDEAEALMARRRQELAEQGAVFRRINQAFFATRSLYATGPASIDPIGEQLSMLRQRSESVGVFLRQAAGLTSGGDLERLLEETALR